MIKKILITFIFCAHSLQAEVKLPALISDNMLLQANKPVPIWGSADVGEKVTVRFAGQTAATAADSNGRWQVRLQPLAAHTSGTMTVEGKNKLSVRNVLVGTVWVFSGQSNMEMGVLSSASAMEQIPKANYPKIRLFKVKRMTSLVPLPDVEGQWLECSPETLKQSGQGSAFSAVAYYFGRDVHLATGLPVGLIQSAWGGTNAEAWTSLAGLQSEPGLSRFPEQYRRIVSNLPALKAKYQDDQAAHTQKLKIWQESNKAYLEQLAAWGSAAIRARQEGLPLPPRPVPDTPEPRGPGKYGPDEDPAVPSSLSNAMIDPLIPYAIEGVGWFQGENHTGSVARAREYRLLFSNLIKDWRSRWGEGDFPFYYCQLANFTEKTQTPDESNGAEVREMQRLTLGLPNTGMAVLIDLGESKDIHFRNKMEVGARLARIALAKTFSQKVRWTGPVYRSLKVEGDKIRLSFDPVGGELVARELPETYNVSVADKKIKPLVRNRPGSQLEGFAICGADRKWVWADAIIDGQTVLVSAPEVKQPVAVRYGWASNPTCNLSNTEGLPASPFQTDDVTPLPAAAGMQP